MAFFNIIKTSNFVIIFFLIFYDNNIEFGCKSLTIFSVTFLIKLIVILTFLVKMATALTALWLAKYVILKIF